MVIFTYNIEFSLSILGNKIWRSRRGATNMFKKVSMNVKQMGSYIIIILFFIVITNTSYNNVNHLRDQTASIGEVDVPKINTVAELKESITQIDQEITKHAFERNLDQKIKIEKQIEAEMASVHDQITKLEKLKFPLESKNTITEVGKSADLYDQLLPQFFEVSMSNDYAPLYTQLEKLTSINEDMDKTLEVLAKTAKTEAQNTHKQNTKDANFFNWEILILSVTASIFSTIIAFFTTRLISRTVKRFAQNVDVTNKSVDEIKKSIDKTALSSQHLDASMNNASDSVGELVASIQQVAENANITSSGVYEISAAVEEMSASVSLVASSADTLSASAEETSSAIQEMMASIEQVAKNAGSASAGVEQISAAIEQMSHSIKGVSNNAVGLTETAEETSKTVADMIDSIKQVAARAQTVNSLSKSVMNDAYEGTLSLNETLNSMQDISQVINQASIMMENLGKNSEEIGSIIAVIDEIADQTNLLALNAAIEAARAGEHGKGFSVVADEVRKLAERSAQATKEISLLIKGIQAETTIAVTSINGGAEKVTIGNQLADKTKHAIQKISEGITRVTEEMNQIAKETEDQQSNSELITLAVRNVTSQSLQMTHSTKEQTITAEEIVKGITDTKDMVQQISFATNEQTKGGHAIVEAIEDVSKQSYSVTNATREQASTSEEILRNINSIKEMINQIMIATNEQAKHGHDISAEVSNIKKQANDLDASIEIQTKEVEDVAKAINEVNEQVKTLK